MTFKTEFKNLYVAHETSYAQASRPVDANYFAIPTAGQLEETDTRTALETNRNTGRPGSSPKVPGPGGGTLSFNTNVYGLDAQGGDGDSPSTDDWLDVLLDGLGIQAERVGENVASHSGTALSLDTDTLTAWDLVPLQPSGGGIRWAFVAADAADGSYTLHNDPGITGALVPPFRQFTDPNGADTTKTFAGAFIRTEGGGSDIENHHPGARIGAVTIQHTAGELATISWTLNSDDVIPDTYTFTAGTNGDPASTPTNALKRSCVFIDGTEIDVASVSVTFNISVAPRRKSCAASGRSDQVLIEAIPTFTIQPVYAETYETEKRSMPNKEIIVAFISDGSGTDQDRQFVVGTPNAQLSTVAPTDASGLLEASLTYMTATVGVEPIWVIART